MDIIEAIKSKELFRSCFRPSLDSWTSWMTLLKAVFALDMTEADLTLYRKCTARKTPPAQPIKELWAICGRRGGKSYISAVIAVFLALFYDYEKYLSPGEKGCVQVIAADRKQAQVILGYVRGILHSTPIFEQYIENEIRESIDLGKISIEVMSCSYRSVRGRTLVCGIFDEMAFWHDSGANPDKEILSAIRPAMATIPTALLIAISSPYARSGSIYETHRDYYGKDDPEVLVWQSPTPIMNPNISQALIDRESKKDPSAARAEWYAEFRDDIETFLHPDVIAACSVIPGDLAPQPTVVYQAFVDPSGGRTDAMTLAIGYQDRMTLKLRTALLRAWKPPFNPEEVVSEIADILTRYRISAVTGDKYGAAWVSSAFEKFGISYNPADKVKSDLYLEFEGYANTQRVELPINKKLAQELINLERKRGKSGKDSVDHPPRGSDDLANAVAGLTRLLVGTEHSFFHGCDIQTETIELMEKGKVSYRQGELEILRVVAGLALPGQRPGFLVVAAEAESKESNDRFCLVLEEFEEPDPSRLIRQAIKFKSDHSSLETIFARNDPFIEAYNKTLRHRGERPLYIREPPNLETAGPEGGYISFHLKLVKDRLAPENKTLLLPKDSKLPGYLTDITTDRASRVTDAQHPAIAAISYLVAAMDTWRYDPCEQEAAEAACDDLSIMFDF